MGCSTTGGLRKKSLGGKIVVSCRTYEVLNCRPPTVLFFPCSDSPTPVEPRTSLEFSDSCGTTYVVAHLLWNHVHNSDMVRYYDLSSSRRNTSASRKPWTFMMIWMRPTPKRTRMCPPRKCLGSGVGSSLSSPDPDRSPCVSPKKPRAYASEGEDKLTFSNAHSIIHSPVLVCHSMLVQYVCHSVWSDHVMWGCVTMHG